MAYHNHSLSIALHLGFSGASAIAIPLMNTRRATTDAPLQETRRTKSPRAATVPKGPTNSMALATHASDEFLVP